MKQLTLISQTIQDVFYRQVFPQHPMATEHFNDSHWAFWAIPESDHDVFGNWFCLLGRTDCGAMHYAFDDDIPDIITPMETAIWRESSGLYPVPHMRMDDACRRALTAS